MSATCNFLSFIPHLTVNFKTIPHHAFQNEHTPRLSISLSLCIPPKPCWTLVSVLTFRIADSLPRDHLLQKVNWLFLILVLLFCQSSLVLRCPHPLIACDMVALGIHQGIQTTLNAGSRVLTATKPLVLAYEDANRMDFGVEESFLAKVSATEVEITLLNK